MSTPLPAPTDEIRLTQIPGELRRLNEANAELRAALRRSTGNYVDAARERDEARNQIAEARIARLPASHQAVELRAARDFVRNLWDLIETTKAPTLEDVADLLRDFVAEHGAECEVCEGVGEVADERMIGDPSAMHGYSTVRVAGECAHCRGGRVPR